MNRDNPCRFEEVSTEQLDSLLHTELEKEKIDRSTVMKILHILEEREADKPVELTEEVVSAWGKFRNTQKRKSTDVKKHSLWITKVAAVFVAVSILAVSIPAAAGLGFFEAIAQWTADVFRFVGTPTKTEVPEDYVFETDNPDLQKVYDAVCEMGVKYPVVPTWLPEGYSLYTLQTFMNSKDYVVARFKNGRENISFFIRKGKWRTTDITKDENIVEKYTCCSIDHYIIKNVDETKVVWVVEDFMVTISFNSKMVPIRRMIDSVYE